MTRRQLHEQVALATGDSIDTVRARGFQLLSDETPLEDDQADVLWLECSGCKQNLCVSASGFEGLPEFAECVRCDAYFDYQFEDLFSADPAEIERSEARQELCEAA